MRFPQLRKRHWSDYIALFWRFCQLILGVAVIGLYAQDLNAAHREGKYTDGKWAYATATGTIASATALAYLVFTWTTQSTATLVLFGWDWLVFILWVALVAIFGPMYVHENPEMDAGVLRMKNAVWVDMTNMCMWFVTAVLGTVWFFMSDHGGLWKRRRGGGAKVP